MQTYNTDIEKACFVLVDALQKEANERAIQGDIFAVHWLVSQSQSIQRLSHHFNMRFGR